MSLSEYYTFLSLYVLDNIRYSRYVTECCVTFVIFKLLLSIHNYNWFLLYPYFTIYNLPRFQKSIISVVRLIYEVQHSIFWIHIVHELFNKIGWLTYASPSFQNKLSVSNSTRSPHGDFDTITLLRTLNKEMQNDYLLDNKIQEHS